MTFTRGISYFILSCIVASTIAVVEDPCDQGPPLCIPPTGPCIGKEDECCAGLGCFGYNFFKKCQPPPVCLGQWYDCSQGMDCCDDLVCAITNSSGFECQVLTIDTRVADFKADPSGTRAPTPAPTSSPGTPVATIPPRNIRTTRVPGQPVRHNVGCSVGDPHIYTFDGLAHDCQAEGEFILVKSTYTQRQIQGRYAFFSDRFSANNAWSVTRGVAIQDEGDTPRVQINIPILSTSLAPNKVSNMNCPVQFFVDGVQRDLNNGSGQDDKVRVTVQSSNIEVFYVASEMRVTIGFGYANGCFIDVCVHLPDTDPTIGLLGTADKNPNNDWTDREGHVLHMPTSMWERMQRAGYEYCTQIWCIREESESLFVYPEKGVGFKDIMKCNLPHGNTMQEFLETVSPEIIALCKEDLVCMVDASMGGDGMARTTQLARVPLTETCNGIGGECTVSRCCDGLLCVEKEGFARQCADTRPVCVNEWATCNDSDRPCCGDMMCVESNDGRHVCRNFPECISEWQDCRHVKCCGDMTCVERDNRQKQCVNLPKCMPEWQECNLGIPCCDGFTCVFENNMHFCKFVPTVQDQVWGDCSTIPCVEGLTCIPQLDGRKLCEKLPACVAQWQNCEWVGCCQDGPIPLKCVVATEGGRTAKRCEAACIEHWGCMTKADCCNPNARCETWGGPGPGSCVV